MSRYVNVKVNVSQGQVDKIKRAAQAGSSVSIRLSHADLNGEHMLALTQAQVNKIAKAYQSGTGVTIKMSRTQLLHNAKVRGWFY
jgi:L-aminopeptidase/D-esterase-like protein